MPKYSQKVTDHLAKRTISVDYLIEQEFTMKELDDICTYRILGRGNIRYRKPKLADDSPTYEEYLTKAGLKKKSHSYA